MNTATEPTTEITELLIVEETQIEISQAFSPKGLDPVIDKIRKEALSHVPDVTTAAGRAAIASVAHKVAKSKTGLDDMGKDLVSGWKTKAKAVDAERKRMREVLDELKGEVRQPLTNWEEKEEKRVARIKAELKWVRDLSSTESCHSLCAGSLTKRKDELLKAIPDKDYYNEFYDEAISVKAVSLDRLEILITQAKRSEADAAELEKLRKENEEREAKEEKAKEARDKLEVAARAKMDSWDSDARYDAGEPSGYVQESIDKMDKEKLDEAFFGPFIGEAHSRLTVAKNNLVENLELAKRKEAEAIAEVEAEKDRERVEGIQDRISNISRCYKEAKGCRYDSGEISRTITQVSEIEINDSFQELKDDAQLVKDDTIQVLEVLLKEVLQQEVDAKQAQEDLIEKTNLQAIEDEKERVYGAKTKREQDAEHVRKCKQAASAALQNQLGYTKEKADELVEAIHQNLIPNITLNL